MTIDRLLIIAK